MKGFINPQNGIIIKLSVYLKSAWCLISKLTNSFRANFAQQRVENSNIFVILCVFWMELKSLESNSIQVLIESIVDGVDWATKLQSYINE